MHEISFFSVTICLVLYFSFIHPLSTIACACARTMCFDYKLWCLRKPHPLCVTHTQHASPKLPFSCHISHKHFVIFVSIHFSIDTLIIWLHEVTPRTISLGQVLFSMPILFEQRFIVHCFFRVHIFQILLSFHYFRIFSRTVLVVCFFHLFIYSSGW